MSGRATRSWMFALNLLCTSAAPAATVEPTGASRADMGVSLAITGQTSRAESLFISMLSDARGDARALNNLGNLKLLRGDLGVALAFYDRAAKGDSADAGIHLNRATVLMMMGDTHRAQRAAARGIELAGSEANALGLLGLKGDSLSQRAENNVLVNKNEIRALLKNAAASVPGTSAKKPVGTTAPTAKGKSATAWRPAGPRAADQSDAASVLYWKH